MPLFQRFTALTLAFLMMGTSVCFAVDKHMCEGDVWSYSWYGNADICEKMQQTDELEVKSCCANKIKQEENNNETKFSKTPCCSQETVINETINGKDQPVVTAGLNIPVATIPNLSSFYPFTSLVNDQPNYVLRPPPDDDRDIQSLFQVFRI